MGKNNRHIVCSLFLTGVLCACGSGTTFTPGGEVSIPTTASGDAQPTVDFLPSPVATATTADQDASDGVPSPEPTISTADQPTSELSASSTSGSGPATQEGAAPSPNPNQTPDPRQPTSEGPRCDDAQFLEDVTSPDGTPMKPGEGFKKTWRFKNTGVCTWTTAYAIGYAYGEKMHGSETKLTKSVAPGGTVDVSINFTAPLMKNCWYGSWWRLKNASGVYFGDFVYVSILISDGIDTTTVCPTQTPGI
jgi:hypothetical protein